MTMHNRGLVAARAEADPKDLLAQINKEWSDFKGVIDSIKSRFDKDDYVKQDEIGKINASIQDVQNQLQTLNALRQTADLDGAAPTAQVRAHAKAFDGYFRKGDVSNLRDLEVKAALTSQNDPNGGYLVPREVSTMIDRTAQAQVVMRQIASVQTITAPEYRKYVSVGGATSGWVGEEDSRSETSTPTLKELIYTMQEIYALPYTTQRLLDTAITDVGAWLASEVGIAFAEAEDSAFMTGTGVKQPYGLTTASKVANASWAWGSIGYVVTGTSGAFAASGPADAIIATLYALKPKYRGTASWLMSDATMLTVRQQKDGQGNYLWAPPTAEQLVPTILGKPVYTDDYMPAIAANSYSVAVGDFKQAYHIFDMAGVRVLRDDLTTKGKVAFYTQKYVAGGIGNFEAVKFLKFGTS